MDALNQYNKVKEEIDCSLYSDKEDNFENFKVKVEDVDNYQQNINSSDVWEQNLIVDDDEKKGHEFTPGNLKEDPENGTGLAHSSSKTDDTDSVKFNSKQLKCKICDYATNQKIELKKHKRIVHFSLMLHECPECEYSTRQAYFFLNHLESAHFKLKKYRCQLCEYAASDRTSLRSHIYLVHSYLTSYKCDLCNFSCYMKNILNKHKENVHSKKRHREYSTSRKIDLERQVGSVRINLRQRTCQIYEYAKYRKNQMKYSDVKIYKCRLCEYSTTGVKILKHHIKSLHSRLKLEGCNECKVCKSLRKFQDAISKISNTRLV